MKRIVALLLILSLSGVSSAAAEVLFTPGRYYNNSERIGLTGGRIRIRAMENYNGPLQLINIRPPSMKAGCGGLDFNFGGISFASIEQLVKKFENLISAAPAVFFDLALSVLCEQCKAVKDNINAAIDRLNSLQFDECAILKGLRDSMEGPVKKSLANNQADSFFKGLNSITDQISSAANWVNTGTANLVSYLTPSARVASCGEYAKKFAQQKSILGAILELNTASSTAGPSKTSFTQNQAGLYRGLFGDIVMTDNNIAAKMLPPCPNTNRPLPDLLALGEALPTRNSPLEERCSSYQLTGKPLRTWIQDIIIGPSESQVGGIIGKFTSQNQNGSLSEDEQFILASSPYPLQQEAKLYLFTRDKSRIKNLVDDIATHMSLSILVSMAERYESSLTQFIHTVEFQAKQKDKADSNANPNEVGSRPQDGCDLETMKVYMDRAMELAEKIRKQRTEWVQKLAPLDANQDAAARNTADELNKYTQKYLARFREQVAKSR